MCNVDNYFKSYAYVRQRVADLLWGTMGKVNRMSVANGDFTTDLEDNEVRKKKMDDAREAMKNRDLLP